MENYTPLKKMKNRKKINKFLVTGNLLLVVLIAVIGFAFYNNNLQTTQQKAGFDCSDWSDKRKCAEERKEYEESGQADADKEAKKKKERDEKRMKEEEYVPAGGCPGGYTECNLNDAHGSRHRFCINENGSEGGCNSGGVNRGIDVIIGGGGEGTGAWRCIPGVNNYTTGSCDSRNYAEILKGCSVPKCFCGIIQIDNCNGTNATYQSTCGCGSKEEEQQITTTVVGTIVPTPTGEIPTSTPTPTIPTVTEIPTPTDTVFIITPTNIPTSTVTPTPTIAKLVCATKDCNETSRPCEPGNICIKANDGSNYCSNESLVEACKSNPTESVCCKIGPSSTPTEIIIAKTTITPTTVAKLLETGVTRSFIYLIPAAIMLIGLIL